MRCEVCGKECNGKTCSGACRAKLSRRTHEAHAHGAHAPEAHAPSARTEVTQGGRPVEDLNQVKGTYEPKDPETRAIWSKHQAQRRPTVSRHRAIGVCRECPSVSWQASSRQTNDDPVSYD